MAQSTLAKKLRIQPGQRALFLNAPQGYIQSLSDMPENVEASENADGKFGFVQVFVKDSEELNPITLGLESSI